MFDVVEVGIVVLLLHIVRAVKYSHKRIVLQTVWVDLRNARIRVANRG